MTLDSRSDLATTGAEACVIQTLPLFEMMRMRAATTARRHPTLGFASDEPGSSWRWVNQFTHTHRRLGPDDREVVSPNNDTVYSNAWIDLSQGPVLIESPDMGERYWTLGLLDAWTNPFAYVGRRTTGSRPQCTLVHGPGWRGDIPAEVTSTIAAPGDDVWLIGRILVDDDGPDAGRVRSLQQALRLRRLDGGDAAMRVDAALDGRDTRIPRRRTTARWSMRPCAEIRRPTASRSPGRPKTMRWRQHCRACTNGCAPQASPTRWAAAGPSR